MSKKIWAIKILAKAKEKEMIDFSEKEILRTFGNVCAPQKCINMFRKLIAIGLQSSDLHMPFNALVRHVTILMDIKSKRRSEKCTSTMTDSQARKKL